MGDSQYYVQSKNTKAKAYEYYSDIISYPQRYPEVYAYVKELNRSSNNLEVDTSLRINFANEQYSNSVRVTTRYTFSPQNEIRYEVIDGYGKGRIKNSINIKEPSNHAIQQGCKREIEVNHLPLDIISIESHGLEETDPMHEEYIRKGLYLKIQDHVYFEGNADLEEIIVQIIGLILRSGYSNIFWISSFVGALSLAACFTRDMPLVIFFQFR